MKLTGWVTLSRLSTINHRWYCDTRMIKGAIVDRIGCIPGLMNGVVNKKNLKLLLSAVLIIAINGFIFLPHGFGDRQQVSYIFVQVSSGDTVWRIAARYVTATENIQEKIFAIRQANKLNNNAEIYPGQVLKVPVVGPTTDKSNVPITSLLSGRQ